MIPAYNEAATIRGLAERALAHADRVVIVDDGSCDGTSDALEALPVEVLREPVNRGKGNALRRGFRRAMALDAAAVVTLDGDGQHDPRHIDRLARVARREPGALVIGARDRGNHGAPRRRQRANRVADFFIAWAAGVSLVDTQSGFRLYPRALVERLLARRPRDGFTFESEALIVAGRAGVPVRFVAVPSVYGSSPRRSHFRPVRDITRITVMVAGWLLRDGFYLQGLARARTPGPEVERPEVQSNSSS